MTADNATDADHANTANHAIDADRANTANHANTATNAQNANTANTATEPSPRTPAPTSKTGPGANQTVASLNLPAGTYALNAKVLANNNASSIVDVDCRLELQGTVVDSGFSGLTLGGVDSGADRG